MKEYNLIVVGSGAGMNVASNAIQLGMRVAVVEHGLMGGTCLNTGCIPSKILLYPADVIRELDEAKAIGVEGTITKVDFPLMMQRMRIFVDEDREQMESSVDAVADLRWYRETGEFVGDYQLKVGKETITAPKIVIASGARALVPPIEGLVETGYIDHVSVLQLDAPPESLIIIGGGYIACEYGHFFSALGTKVTLLEMMPRLLLGEDPEISEIVKRRFSKYAEIHTNHEVVKVAKRGDQKVVTALNREDDQTRDFTASEVMLAAGVRSVSDLLKPEKTGVETDKHGWIKVNEYLETTKPDIWALGDALGRHMFRHTANYEAQVVWMNAFTEHRHPVDYHAVPHAVYGYPQVGGVGLTEQQAKAAGYEILVGRAEYMEVTKGYAMGEEDGLVKVVVEQGTGRILGCHIVGSHAAILVQQIVYLMNAGEQDYIPLADSQVIHPALSEVVINAFGNMAPPDYVHEHHG
ncbi:MAG: dihydrolipoyl dehydrogenase [Anaerolineae bacterium]|nr:dihydrolipoyl dehydrogenase [Anaerolineae bacterium]NIN97400.1 dihydrolipoyl dehydrogenase [Anaerolineae bacterium]NIQ80329.1 dihydrolipoyl dehydrogenase [Anaerolineae bacterium]